MEAVLPQVIVGIVLMLIGALGTGVVWIIQAILQLKKDVDAAHIKLRIIEEKEKCQLGS